MPYWIVDAGTDIDISKFWKNKNCIGYSNSIDEVKKNVLIGMFCSLKIKLLVPCSYKKKCSGDTVFLVSEISATSKLSVLA